MPQLPPGLDPNALPGGQGLPPGFKLPKLDFNKLNNPKRDDDKH
jgi:signal recognition particle subunit SRP54